MSVERGLKENPEKILSDRQESSFNCLLSSGFTSLTSFFSLK